MVCKAMLLILLSGGMNKSSAACIAILKEENANQFKRTYEGGEIDDRTFYQNVKPRIS